MRIGGWWRLWIGMSVVWVGTALAVAFVLVGIPTRDSVARDVGSWCDLGFPIPADLASRVLEVPGQLARLQELDGDANADARKPIIKAVKSTIETLASRAKRPANYDINIVGNKSETRIVISPETFTDAQVLEQAERERYRSNSWADLQGYCLDQLQQHSRDDLFRAKRKEWLTGTLLGALSLPLLTLLLGGLSGWIWRGFRTSQSTH